MGPDTGAGGTAPTTASTSTGGLLAGLAALGGIGMFAARRRGNATA